MRNLLTLLFLFFIINTSFADNYTYLKGPQISFSNQLVTSSGGTTTFNSLTPMITTVTGTQTQIIKLPSVSSIPVGYSYQIINESTQALTVKDSLDVVIASIEPGTDKKFILFTGGSWSVSSGGGGQGGSDHNSLTSLQGGTTGEYYHLTAAEDTAVASLSGTTTNYVLKRSATGFANSILFDNGTFVGIGNAAPTTKLDVTGDITTSGYVYFGNSTTDGSFRMTVSGGALVVQKRISGVWTQVVSFDEN